METNKVYSLCPRSADAVPRLLKILEEFADQHGAKLINRGAEVQQELSDIKSSIQGGTGENVILVTVVRAGYFRVSVTNLGLREKVALAIRSFRLHGEEAPKNQLLSELRRYWTIQEVDGSVENDPPC